MNKVPSVAIKRLSLYVKQLSRLLDEGEEVVLSKELASRLGFNPTQVRKDLSYFGKFGKRKKGYDVETLHSSLREILGVSTHNKISIFGAGNLGQALLGFQGFEKRGYVVEGLFDADDAKVGKIFHGKKCYSITEAKKIIKKKEVTIAILAVPDEAVESVLESVLDAGIKSILNFTQRRLRVPENVMVRSVDFSDKLESLSYFSKHKG